MNDRRRDDPAATASCHCGAVRIDLLQMPKTITRCNCSICHRYGALWAYRTHETARVVSGTDVETAYLWNDREIEFYHCNVCGCVTRYEGVDKSPGGRIAVNARMMAPELVAGIRVRNFDGADTWRYVD